MKVENMRSAKGNPVPNQFIITSEGHGALGNFLEREVFQSYNTIIAEKTVWSGKTVVKLDRNAWNYSRTTSKYRSIFLGESTAETQKKIDSGEYILENLN